MRCLMDCGKSSRNSARDWLEMQESGTGKKQERLRPSQASPAVLPANRTPNDNTLPTPYRQEKERYTHTQSKQTGRDQKLQRRKPTLRKKPSANSLHHALPNPRPRGARLHHHRVAPEPETHAHARPTRP